MTEERLPSEEPPSFDFGMHEKAAVAEYLKVQPFYLDLANLFARTIEACLERRQIKVHSVQFRAKDAASLGRKASLPLDANPNAPRYAEPLREITDLAGVRVIAFFPNTLADIDALLRDEFDVVERSDKSEELLEDERFGYRSIHYLLRLKEPRTKLAEYGRFGGAVTEIQVRTILQHAWAEIEHDIQYKSSTAIPTEIRRRFMALAGMLEIADREFQGIQDEDKRLAVEARDRVSRGALEGVEITPDALKAFLDRRLGADGRISEWSYTWATRILKALGFRDLDQVEKAIAPPWHDDQLSTIAWTSRQGQIVRFELMLLAALGEEFVARHPWRNNDWFANQQRRILAQFRAANLPVGCFNCSGLNAPGKA